MPLNLARRKQNCLIGAFACPSSTNSPTMSRAEMIYHIAKKHSTTSDGTVHKRKRCDTVFTAFIISENKNKKKGEREREKIKSSKCTCYTSKEKRWWPQPERRTTTMQALLSWISETEWETQTF